MITMEEKALLRELAKRYGEIATDARQQDAIRRMRDTNDLKIVRPPVLMDEIPWHEMNVDDELTLRTQDPEAQRMETFFRRALFRRKHFACDALMEPFYPVAKSFTSTGNGLSTDERQIASNAENNIVSHEYHDVIPDEEALERMHMPVITAHPEEDVENLARIQEILGDALPARLQGVGVYYAPWDRIPRLHGVENCFTDMLERPEFMHQVIAKFTQEGETLYQQYEDLGLLDATVPSLHCTPSYITGCPRDPQQSPPHKRKDLWFRSMAQMFTSVSPKMLWEFDLSYSMPLMEKFAYTYYGCCEALDNKIPLLKRIPNLRKIGVSPWAGIECCCEQIGRDYVAARKPNPALVATVADPQVIAQETEDMVKACLKYGCPVEFVLKDISTVGFRPENLMVWSRTVSQVLDRYYG